MTSTIGAFDGFGDGAMDFLEGLAADHTKAYFDAHRAIYDDEIARPMKELVVAVGERLAESVDADIGFEPRIGKSLFRINRDLRFSKDKTPYNTYLDAAWWHGDDVKTSPAFILRITADTVLTGVGIYGIGSERLSRYRDAVVGVAGDDLALIVAELQRSVEGASLSEASRKRVPKGYDADHPRAQFLLRDGFHVSASVPTPALITSPKFAKWVAARLAEYASLQRWLVANV